jgi:iron-sulfur cluster assembly protein
MHGSAMITVTKTALKRIQEIMKAENRKAEGSFLRIKVVGGGCSGLNYHVEFEDAKKPNDLMVEIAFPESKDDEEKLQIVIDQKSFLFLKGLELDYKKSGLMSNFEFNNPNAQSTCGCGTSFSPIQKKQ